MNIFDRYYTKYDTWYDTHKFAYLSELEVLKKVMPKTGRGLEIGVGTGRFAAPLNITIGIDPSYNMLEIASRRDVNVRWGFGEDLPFLENSFDYVAIIITLCFVDDPLKVLQESRRVLKNDGELILGIIDKNSFLGKFYQKKKSIFYKNAYFFKVEEVVNLRVGVGMGLAHETAAEHSDIQWFGHFWVLHKVVEDSFVARASSARAYFSRGRFPACLRSWYCIRLFAAW